MRILHTSDWHLGRQFYNQSLLEDQRLALQQICTVVSECKVDVVIVAGDIYDRSVPPASAVELLDKTVHHICNELQVPMILIAGNHDSPERLAFGSRQLSAAGLYVTGTLWQVPQEIVLRGKGGDEVAFYPIPYTDPITVRHCHAVDLSTHNDALHYLVELIHEKRSSERPAVAIAHCFLAGGEASESERPLAIGGIEYVAPEVFQEFDYTALGHLHGPQFRGAEMIRYSGSPLKYSFSEERQHKSVTLVDLSPGRGVQIEKIAIKPARNMRTLEGALDDLLELGKTDPQREDYLQIRLTDTHAILDVMNKLREQYPNILHLERPGLSERHYLHGRRERIRKGELSMFEDFYRQVTDSELTVEQRQVIAGEIEQLHREDS